MSASPVAAGSAGPDVAALFAGRIDDGGFMEYGHRGLERARAGFGLRTTFMDGVAPVPELLAGALRELARTGAALVVAHGGQNDPAARAVAAEFPAVRFAVTQGSVHGPNLSSYEVRQEQSAFLAGVAAAHLTRSGVVGHISGIRVRPGLLGRTAWAAGVAAVDPGIRLLTTFCGTQDDEAVAARVAAAQAAAGADVVFTMLNAAIGGAISACRDSGARLIGNVRDWVAVDPAVFVGSAMADVGIGVHEACRDHARGTWRDGVVRRIGVEDPAAVRLRLAPGVDPAVERAVSDWCERLADGRAAVPEHAHAYAGEEFEA